jgi:UDP-N-acetylglucosamine--N-acetylmuramyl-(pentapeptide) pyrophosphoryl-undecaprenol N-acetylglucosamine transferase
VTVIALAGGGTAGHITPLRAVGEKLMAAHPGVSLLVIGTRGGRERELLPEAFSDMIEVEKLPFPRKLGWSSLTFPLRFMRSVAQIRRSLRARSVSVVAGFGGYIAAPTYLAARLEKIPLVIHEANVLPGLANRLGARWTRDVAVCFPGTPLPHARVVGMPLPDDIVTMDRWDLRGEALTFFGLSADKPVLLVTGGSSGAVRINEVIVSRATALVAAGWQVLHLLGPTQQPPAAIPEGYHWLPYCSRMDLAYSAADLVISRAGAATVSELAVAGCPAVLVPYHVGNGEQEANARFLVDAGAARVVAQADFTPAYIDSQVLPLMADAVTRQKMAGAASAVAVTNAAEVFADMVWQARKGTR